MVALTRQQVWSSSAKGLASLAVALQESTTALLQQSAFSLSAMNSDIGEADEPSRVLATLRETMRFDPDSTYLGIWRKGRADPVAVGQTGELVSAEADVTIRQHLPEAADSGFQFGALVRLGRDKAPHLPLVLSKGGGSSQTILFALVPVTRLTRGAEGLALLPSSQVAFVTAKGQREFMYDSRNRFIELHGTVPASVMARARAAPIGSWEFVATYDGRERVLAYSRSAAFPFYLAAFVETSALRASWLRQAAAPIIVLLLALAASAVFAAQLHRAVRDQQLYASAQEYVASHDTLTGLLNRDAFIRNLTERIAADPNGRLAVLLLDLNRFKDINDTLGHAAGDRVLQELGSRAAAVVGEGCDVARLGGDELAFAVSATDRPQAVTELTAAVHSALQQPVTMQGVTLDLAASSGVALYPEDAQSANELLRCADIAMYDAKAHLRPLTHYSKSLDNFSADRLAMHGELTKALREHSLYLLYQPKVSFRNGTLSGVEALSRWDHPTKGAIPPELFISLAETTELIHPLTQYVLEQAIAQAVNWRDSGVNVPVSVNISVNNLLDPNFVGHLEEMLGRSSLQGSLLELEVTESAVMRHPETIVKRLHDIRDLGVQLAIDDFGTGYASLAYLKRLPVQSLKIDKGFIINLARDPADQRIVRSIIRLAHGFGMSVVAEGVESPAVARRLERKGCDYAQGYHYGRPQPAAEIIQRLRAGAWFAGRQAR